MTIQLHDLIEVIKDIPEKKIKKGMMGTVIVVFEKPSLAYDVEFCDNYGRALIWDNLLPNQVKKVGKITKEQYNNRVIPEVPPL